MQKDSNLMTGHFPKRNNLLARSYPSWSSNKISPLERHSSGDSNSQGCDTTQSSFRIGLHLFQRRKKVTPMDLAHRRRGLVSTGKREHGLVLLTYDDSAFARSSLFPSVSSLSFLSMASAFKVFPHPACNSRSC